MPQPDLRRSKALYAEARTLISGGVTSAVRAGARPHPLYVERASGAELWDVDGNRYVDFVLGYGPLLLGHAPALVRDALDAQAARGTAFGSQHQGEVDLARRLRRVVPGTERVVFSTTGSEAVATALRIARCATGRPTVLKFEGHYHGWLDGIFVSTGFAGDRSGPRADPAVVAQTSGMAPGSLLDVVVAPWNDLPHVERIVRAQGDRLAAIILEPVAVNGGLIVPRPGFLEALRDLARAAGCLLVFDEVITGFRVALGGAQERYGVTADLVVLAKALGAGVAVAAVTGPARVMDVVADGSVVHNGTFNGNGLAMAAGVAALDYLERERDRVYPRLEALGQRLARGLADASPRLRVRQVGPIVHTGVDEPHDLRDVRDRATGDPSAHGRWVEALLGHGIHATPRGLWYLSTAHTTEHVDRAVDAAAAAAVEVLDA